MIRLSQVSLRRGAKLLLEQTDLALNLGEHAGLIGANGSGKSSLFALFFGYSISGYIMWARGHRARPVLPEE